MKKWLVVALLCLATVAHATTVDFDIAASSDDGRVYKDAVGAYPPSSATVVDTGFVLFGPERTLIGASEYNVQVGVGRWNTGPTLSGQTVISASLIIYLTNVDNTNTLNFDGDWLADAAITAADYTETSPTTAFSVPISGFALTGTSTYCVNKLCTIPLSNVSNISTTAYTKLRVTISQQGGDAAPTGYNRILAEAFDYPGVHQVPRLEVVYGLTPTPTSTGTPTPTNTPTVTPTSATTTTAWPTGTCLTGVVTPCVNGPVCRERLP